MKRVVLLVLLTLLFVGCDSLMGADMFSYLEVNYTEDLPSGIVCEITRTADNGGAVTMDAGKPVYLEHQDYLITLHVTLGDDTYSCGKYITLSGDTEIHFDIEWSTDIAIY